MRQIPQEINSTIENMPKSPETFTDVTIDVKKRSLLAHLYSKGGVNGWHHLDGFQRMSADPSQSFCRVEYQAISLTHGLINI